MWIDSLQEALNENLSAKTPSARVNAFSSSGFTVVRFESYPCPLKAASVLPVPQPQPLANLGSVPHLHRTIRARGDIRMTASMACDTKRGRKGAGRGVHRTQIGACVAVMITWPEMREMAAALVVE